MSEVVYGGGEPVELDALAVYSHPDDAELPPDHHTDHHMM